MSEHFSTYDEVTQVAIMHDKIINVMYDLFFPLYVLLLFHSLIDVRFVTNVWSDL